MKAYVGLGYLSQLIPAAVGRKQSQSTRVLAQVKTLPGTRDAILAAFANVRHHRGPVKRFTYGVLHPGNY